MYATRRRSPPPCRSTSPLAHKHTKDHDCVPEPPNSNGAVMDSVIESTLLYADVFAGSILPAACLGMSKPDFRICTSLPMHLHACAVQTMPPPRSTYAARDSIPHRSYTDVIFSPYPLAHLPFPIPSSPPPIHISYPMRRAMRGDVRVPVSSSASESSSSLACPMMFGRPTMRPMSFCCASVTSATSIPSVGS